jgi:hypothetical protein
MIDLKPLMFILILIIVCGASYAYTQNVYSSGWRYDEYGRSYYNLYDGNGTIIKTVYMEDAQIIAPNHTNTQKDRYVYCEDYETQ